MARIGIPRQGTGSGSGNQIESDDVAIEARRFIEIGNNRADMTRARNRARRRLHAAGNRYAASADGKEKDRDEFIPWHGCRSVPNFCPDGLIRDTTE